MSEKNNEILTYIKSKIESWLDASEGRSLNMLSRRSGQSYTYVYRLSKGDAQIHLEKVSPILGQICSPDEVIYFYRNFYRDLSDVAIHVYKAAQEYNKTHNNLAKTDSDVKEYLKDPNYFHIIALCMSEKGYSLQKLQYQLGIGALGLIYELLEKEILKKVDDNIIFDGHNFADDVVSGLNAVKNACDVFLKRKTGIVYLSEINSYKQEALRRIESKHREMLDLLIELRNDPDAKGEIPFSYNVAFGKLEFENDNTPKN